MANNDYLDYINLDGVEYDIKDNISGYITGITGTDVTEALGDISANNVFAGPTSGNADEASFRQLVVDDIPSIPVSKISNFPSTMPPSSHTHGDITNSGDITTTATIASGDRLVINDESASKVTNSSITFGTSTATFLANNGTWLTPANTDTKVAQNPTNDANEYPILIKHSANQKIETDEVNFVESKKEDGVTINPSTSVITAAQLTIRGSVSNDSDAATKAYADGKQTKITASGILKGNGSGGVSAAVAGTDYAAADHTHAYIPTSEKGANSGVAELDSSGKVPTSQLPSYVDDILEYSSESNFPSTGETGKIYVDTTTNLIYRWSGTQYTEISSTLALGETSSTAYRGDRGKTAYDHATDASRLTTAQTSGLYKFATTGEGHIASVTAVEKSDITALGIPAQDTTYTFDGTYNASSNKVATVSTVTNAINALDGGTIGAGGTTKTITSLSQTNGNVSATFENIAFPVTSVNTQTGAVTLTASDVGALPDSTDVTKWDTISLVRQQQIVDNDTSYVAGMGTNISSGTTATYYPITTVPRAHYIPKYDANSYLISTTPSANDNSRKVATTAYVDGAISNIDALPAQSGNSGKYLTTNGTTASWGTIDALPSQSGNSGKFLTTNGTTASWANVDALPESSVDTPQYLRYDGPNVNDSAYWDELPIYEQIDYTGALLFEANNLYMTDPGIWSDSNYDGQGVNEFADYIIQSGITNASDFPQIGFSISSTENWDASMDGSLICSYADVSTAVSDYDTYTITCTYETPSSPGWLEVSFYIEYTYNSLDNIYGGYISSITLTSLGTDSTFDPANIILQALLPNITIHKLDGKFLNENAAPLNTYMKKDVDYVTAGKQYGTTLGTKATAEGEYNTASGNRSHAEGYYSSASGAASHAENYHTTASGSYTHAEGYYTTASGNYSHAEGYYTTAQRKSQHVFGEYNILDTAGSTTIRGTYVEIVGNGSSTSNRNNARTLDWSGNETLAGKLTLGADPTANMEAATKQYVDNKVSTLVVPTIKTIENPQISAVNGVFTWTISASSAGGNTNSNILITIYELSTGAVVYPNVVVNQSTRNVTITINGTGTLAASTYKAVIIA